MQIRCEVAGGDHLMVVTFLDNNEADRACIQRTRTITVLIQRFYYDLCVIIIVRVIIGCVIYIGK